MLKSDSCDDEFSVKKAGDKPFKDLFEEPFEIIPIPNTFNQQNIMKHTISIILSAHFDEFISNEISSGRYNSESEVIRAALKLLEAEESKKIQMTKALTAGEASGFSKNFDPKSHLKKLHSKLPTLQYRR